MGAYVFNNQPFDSWLNKKSDDILSKVDREMITTEEMIILVLKAQTNHFYHTDIELKNKIDSSSTNLDHKIDSTAANLKEDIKNLDHKIELTATHLEEKFNFLDKKIDSLDNKIVYLDKKIDSRFMWMIGITIATSGGIYLKLFLG